MKILVVAEPSRVLRKDLNSFISVFAHGLEMYGHEVTCSVDELWINYSCYDLIFFQFPTEIGANETRNVEELFVKLRDAKIRTAITCHDMKPHDNDVFGTYLYNFLYEHVDIMHHMGQYSYDYFKVKFPEKHHFIAQHPIYYDIASLKLDSSACKKELGLPADKKIIMAFGQFRNDEEIEMFRNLGQEFGNDVLFYAQRIETGRLYNGWDVLSTLRCVRKRIHLHSKNFMYGMNRIDEDLVPKYFAAADAIFIQRKTILNSGNLPMAFSAGKPVIGPDRGNVGTILNSTGNYIFNPDDTTSIVSSVKNVIKDWTRADAIGVENHKFALSNMTMETVFKEIDKNIN